MTSGKGVRNVGDTINRFYSRLSPQAGQSCLMDMLRLSQLGQEKLLYSDEMLRGTKASGTAKREPKPAALSMVRAWASDNELVLAQVAFEQGCETAAMKDVLVLLDLGGASVSRDAAGCHPDIAKRSVDQSGAYALALKANQGQL